MMKATSTSVSSEQKKVWKTVLVREFMSSEESATEVIDGDVMATTMERSQG